MKSVKIGQLKNKLSAYLRLVRKGAQIIVMDREHPIARITPFEEKEELRIIPAQKKFSEIKKLSFSKPKVQIDVVALLREDRDKR
ncbi:MAG: type II toxin-antitoxin system prevent-host-death family antitoxin [Deltaproteobacteria bacterium]|nr:type II toxin-antitoxin system prevent-host-death family antitoxin [Deltaproteobacteria bacterium]MBI3017324.1 type II toxin-antitoxin system prevent-host-death family antitoxin [Deltaproteobacteria bacterium]